MSKKLKFLAMMLTCILLSINQMLGQASVGTTMWAEDFSGYSADDVPKGSTSNSHTGTTVYNSGSVTYSCGGDGSTPKIMDAGSPGTGNNMILYKNNGYFEISGIPTGGATELTLSYAVSGSGTLNISCTSANASISGTTITISSGSTFDLKFKNTKSDKNLRLDDLSVVVKTAGSGSTKTLSSIAITTQPTTTTYLVGDTFSKTGAVVTATYDDSSTADVSSSATWTPTTGLVAGSNTMTASYTEGGVNKTATTTVTAYAVTLQARDEDGNTIAVGGPGAPSRTGASITPAADAGNYVFKEWQITNASLGSSASTKSNTITNPTGAVTVTAVYYKPITITYKANSQNFTTQTYAYGGTLAFPASNPDGATYSCDGKTFVGWVGEANKDYSHASIAPTYATAGGSVTAAATYYAVFAKEKTGSVAATSKTYTFTSSSWGDAASAWTSGAEGYALVSGRGIQVTSGESGANATTKSSYDDVTKVTVTYSTNASSGAGSIDIKVNGTSYTGSASVSNSGGTTDRTIDFTPPSSALDGAVKITVSCSTSSVYIKSIQIFYTGSTTTYEGYRTACCDDPQLTFGTIASPVTEYVIVREDLASASAGVEIDCNFESNNTSEDITWLQTKRIKTDYHTAQTWNASQTDRCQIDIANKKISAYETGSWQITIAQAMGSTNYCDETATVNVLVKTIDKFVDAVNGNFSGEAQRLEDTGNGIVLPTAETFSTNDGCADGTTRRLLGWIKASDLATYASGRRVDMIDDLKTSDPATNKVIAPGTKVQATGVTWYAVWGVEK